MVTTFGRFVDKEEEMPRKRMTTGYGIQTLRNRITELKDEAGLMLIDGRLTQEPGDRVRSLLAEAAGVVDREIKKGW